MVEHNDFDSLPAHGTEVVDCNGQTVARTYGHQDAGRLAVKYLHMIGQGSHYIIQNGTEFHVHGPSGILTFKTLY